MTDEKLLVLLFAFLYDHGIADKTEESLRDMVVYGLIMLYMVKKHKECLAQVKE